MISFLIALVAFVFVLGLLVTVHEFGHFYFAKKAGILCSEFAIGMGPIIYKVKKGETYFCIRAIPIGGFVSMAGEDLNEELIKVGSVISLQLEDDLVTEIILDEKIEGAITGTVIQRDMYGRDTKELYIELNVNNEIIKYNIAEECYYVLNRNQKYPVAPYDRCFESKTLKERFLTIFAGPAINLVLALLVFLIVGLASGVATNENIIGSVTTNTAQEYLQEGDKILFIDDHEIKTWNDVSTAMAALKLIGNDYIDIIVDRDGETEDISVKATIQINNIGITNISDGVNSIDGHEGDGIVVGIIPSGNKAYELGLEYGDVLLSVIINNQEVDITSWSQMMMLFSDTVTSGTNVALKYSRDDKETTTKEIEIYNDVTLEKLKVEKMSYTIGIIPTTEFSFIGGLKNGFILTWDNATMIFTTLGMVISTDSQITVSDLSGPVGIFGLVQSYVSAGPIAFLSLIGMLSINLFVVNLLPLPALDGGRLVFLGIEGVTKKPVPKKIENAFNTAGFVLLMGLMLYITFQDLLRL